MAKYDLQFSWKVAKSAKKIKKKCKKKKSKKKKKKLNVLKSSKKGQKKKKNRAQHWKCELYMDNKDVVSTSQSRYFQTIYEHLGTW